MDFLQPKSTPTDIGAEICRSLHLDMQILIDFANDFYCVADGKMRVLGRISSFPVFSALGCTNAVQNNVDLAACIDNGRFAAQLDDFAEHAHDAVLEV
jgi:hypothetical protein